MKPITFIIIKLFRSFNVQSMLENDNDNDKLQYLQKKFNFFKNLKNILPQNTPRCYT